MYHWWTLKAWARRNPPNIGVKLGPVTACLYEWDGWHFALVALNREPLIDTGLRAHRR